LELDVEARQGDSGGPIFNQRGELAGVLFGAGQGTTLGSFAPRVSCFLATLAPDIGQANEQALVAVADRPAPRFKQANNDLIRGFAAYPSSPWMPADAPPNAGGHDGLATSVTSQAATPQNSPALAAAFPTDSTLSWQDITANGWYDPAKSALAVVGLVAIALRLVKVVR
jgi:serine protease Do